MEEKQQVQNEELRVVHPESATQQNEERINPLEVRESKKLFSYRVRTFNEVSKETKILPPAVRLYGDLIYKNEITILAGDTGVGKSILAVNIALALAKGTQRNDIFINESGPLATMYIDYELTDVQFHKRFPLENYPDNLFRVDGNPECFGCGIGLKEITDLIREKKPDVVILDNISAFMMDSGKDAEVAISVMKQFKLFQKEFGTTVIVLSHIPKRYENTPLRIDNVAGSKYLANFADSVFFIAKSSKDKNLRYLKHVKGRNSEIPEDVYAIELISNEKELFFDFIDMTSEKEHLVDSYAVNPSDSLRETIRQLKAEGKTHEEIGAIVGRNKSNISRALNKGK